jgi:hypothetical protein
MSHSIKRDAALVHTSCIIDWGVLSFQHDIRDSNGTDSTLVRVEDATDSVVQTIKVV